MKQLLSGILLIGTIQWVAAQDQLVSYYNCYSEVYGGMEDGGISRNESFHFCVKQTITLRDIYMNDEQLTLKKGDTLVISINKYIPYNDTESPTDKTGVIIEEKVVEIPVKKWFSVNQAGHWYYATVLYERFWKGTVAYMYKNQPFVATARAGFDAGNTAYAP